MYLIMIYIYIMIHVFLTILFSFEEDYKHGCTFYFLMLYT